MNDPDCAPESAKSVSTSWTGSPAREDVVTLRENPSTISSLVLLLVFVSLFPTNELRVATNTSESITIHFVQIKNNYSNGGIPGQSFEQFKIFVPNPR